MRHRPLLLIVLDGWGTREETEFNAIAGRAPFFETLLERYPHTLLIACGREVGLPLGVMGNSEVGHMNLGAGRAVFQDISRIDRSIESGEFFENPALTGLFDRVRREKKQLHFVGLISDGGVHSSDTHLATLLELAARRGLPADDVLVHAFTDGRDTPPRSGAGFLEALERDIAAAGVGRIASVVGRYFPMDRDKRWDRVERAYALLVSGEGARAESAAEAARAAYARGVTDEFIEPVAIGDPRQGRIEEGDGVLCFNFRADRMRELVSALGLMQFDGFERRRTVRPEIVTMTSYRADFPFAVAFPPVELVGIFPEIVSAAGLRQLRVAETEKYAHVTFFFSGGREQELPGERRILVPSPRIATYDLKPEMSAREVTDEILRALAADETDVYIVNFANADMVGHSGDFEATCRAVAAVDECLSRIVPEVTRRGGAAVVTADHGNAELMWDTENDQPHTAHTLNPVPIVFCSEDLRGAALRPRGVLADVAPSLLELMELEESEGMDGASLFASGDG